MSKLLLALLLLPLSMVAEADEENGRHVWRWRNTQNTFKTRCELEYAQVSIKGHPHTHKIHIDSEALVKGKRIGQGVWVCRVARGSRVVAKTKRKHCNNVQKYVTNTCSVCIPKQQKNTATNIFTLLTAAGKGLGRRPPHPAQTVRHA